MKVLVTAEEIAAIREYAETDKRLRRLPGKWDRAAERKARGAGSNLSPFRFLTVVRGVLGPRLGTGSSPDLGMISQRLTGKGLTEADVVLSVTRMAQAWRGPVKLSSVLNNLEKFLAEDTSVPVAENEGPVEI